MNYFVLVKNILIFYDINTKMYTHTNNLLNVMNTLHLVTKLILVIYL